MPSRVYSHMHIHIVCSVQCRIACSVAQYAVSHTVPSILHTYKHIHIVRSVQCRVVCSATQYAVLQSEPSPERLRLFTSQWCSLGGHSSNAHTLSCRAPKCKHLSLWIQPRAMHAHTHIVLQGPEVRTSFLVDPAQGNARIARIELEAGERVAIIGTDDLSEVSGKYGGPCMMCCACSTARMIHLRSLTGLEGFL